MLIVWWLCKDQLLQSLLEGERRWRPRPGHFKCWRCAYTRYSPHHHHLSSPLSITLSFSTHTHTTHSHHYNANELLYYYWRIEKKRVYILTKIVTLKGKREWIIYLKIELSSAYCVGPVALILPPLMSVITSDVVAAFTFDLTLSIWPCCVRQF